MKNHIMSFSGGFDSTYMLLNFLEELSKSPKEDRQDKVILVSVTHTSIGNVKNLKEHHAREKILSICKKNYPDIEIDHIKIDISLNTTSSLKGNTGLAQPMIWLSSIMPFMHEDDILYFGHVKDDAEVLVQNSFNKIISGFTEIQYPYSSTCNHKIKIQCPLMHRHKHDVLYSLYKLNKEIFELCVTCESFDNGSKICGICNTCKNLKIALMMLITDEDKDKSLFGLTYFEKWFYQSNFQKEIIKEISKNRS